MLSYLKPRDGPVFPGLESKEVIYAKDQPEYSPLRALISDGPERRVISRWTLTPEQRKAVAEGADIFLCLLTFGGPLQPIQMMVSDGVIKGDNSDWIDMLHTSPPVSACARTKTPRSPRKPRQAPTTKIGNK